MNRPWQVASIVFLALSVFVLIHSFSYPYKDRLGPGPGFFPFWISILTGLLSLGLLLQITLAKNPKSQSASFLPNREGAVRIAIILVTLGFVVAFLNSLGFRISLFLFLFALPLALGVRNWIVVSIVAVAGSFGVFHVFYYWLKLPLPIGALGI